MPAPTLFVRPVGSPLAEPVSLTACSTLRDREGLPIPCPPGCVAHFDAWADPRAHCDQTGTAYSPFPNSLLPWVGHLPNATLTYGWHSREHPCYAGLPPISVQVFSTTDTFLDSHGTPCPAWVVTVDDRCSDSHFTALFVDPLAATAFAAAEVADQLEGCHCQ